VFEGAPAPRGLFEGVLDGLLEVGVAPMLLLDAVPSAADCCITA